MSRQVHGDPKIDENIDKITAYFEAHVFSSPVRTLQNLDKERLKKLRMITLKLHPMLPDIEKYIGVREKQSPHYKAREGHKISQGELNLSEV